MKKLLIFCILIFLCTSIFISREYIIYDEVPPISTAERFAHIDTSPYNDRPIMYTGETYNDQTFSNTLEIYHPPFYEQLLALNMILFGKHIQLLRLFGLFLSLLTLFFLYKIIRKLWPTDWKKIFIITTCIYLINPVLINKSLLINKDTTLVPLLMVMFLYFFIKFYQNIRLRHYLILGLLFGICLWSREVIPPFLLASIFLFYCLNKKFKEAFKVTIIIGLIGITLFFVGWYIFATLSGIDWFTPIKITFIDRVVGNFSFGILLHNLSGWIYDLFWFTPAFLFLLILAGWDRIKNYFKTKIAEPIDLLLIFSGLLFLAFSIKAPDLEHKFTAFAFFSLIIGWFIYKSQIIDQLKSRIFYLEYLLLLIYYIILPNILLILPTILPYNPRNFIVAILIVIVYLAPISLYLFNKEKKIMPPKPFFNLIITCFIFLFIMCAALNIKHIFADYSTIGVYGERGFEETVDYIKANTDKNDILIADFDIAYNTGNRYYDTALVLTKYDMCGNSNEMGIKPSTPCSFSPDKEFVDFNINIDEIFSKDIKYVVYSEFYNEINGGLREDVQKSLNIHYTLIKEIGDFKIWQRKEV